MHFSHVNFKTFKNALGQLIPNRPPKPVITSTNLNNFPPGAFFSTPPIYN